MRIGIDARMYGPSQSGIGNYIRYLLDALFSIDEKNEYVIFLREPEFSKFRVPRSGVKKVLAESRWYSWREQLLMPGLLMKESCDIIHFPHFNAPILYRGKSVVTIHDIIPFYYPGRKVGKSVVRRYGYRAVFWNSIRHSRIVIAVSEHTKADIIDLVDTNPEKIHVIYHGVGDSFSMDYSEADIEGIKEKYNIREPSIFYVGIWRIHKNVPSLIRAFNILRGKYSVKASLVLGGVPDSAYPKALGEIQRSPYKHDIIQTGFIPEADLPLLYKAATLVAHPSLYEGNALSCLESLASGTPVVASNTTAIPEILGEAALYFDPRNPSDIAAKIYGLLNNKELYKRIQAKGIKKAGEYNWLKTAKDTLEIYEQAIQTYP